VSNWPAPTRADHQRFCEIDGWTEKKTVSGKHRDHYRYEKDISGGNVLYTRISHPPDKSTYGAGMWATILRTQLQVTEEEFWDCVQNGVLPDRGTTDIQDERPEQKPAWMIAELLKAGFPQADVRIWTFERAEAELTAYRSKPHL
jgi:hypothetical protein